MKIKLAAIARDEAAYLPEWIFHHLHFGFDAIEIYVNNTSDNTPEVLDLLGDIPVSYRVADDLFARSGANFQSRAYHEMASRARDDGFTHIMFLDIDEFWTPSDFSTSIKSVLRKLNSPEVLSFHWLLHCDEKEFSRCYSKSFAVLQNDHLKTVFKTDISWSRISCHNIVGPKLDYKLSDGSVLSFAEADKDRGKADFIKGELPSYFVLHRMFRSQLEYVSLLGRGRPSASGLKDNRGGYYVVNKNTPIMDLDGPLLDEYYQLYNQFIQRHRLEKPFATARVFIEERFQRVLDLAKRAQPEDYLAFLRVFNRITLKDIVSVTQRMEQEIVENYRVLEGNKQTQSRNIFPSIKSSSRRVFRKLQRAASIKASHNDFEAIDDTINVMVLALQKGKFPPQRQMVLLLNMAREYESRGELMMALAHVTKAIELNPEAQGPKQFRQKIIKTMGESI